MPQYLYRLALTRPAMLAEGPTGREATIVGEHFRHLQQLVADGVVLMAGRTSNAGERTFGVVLLVAASDAEAAAFMESDPAVRRGVMTAELFPFRVALWSAAGPKDDDGGE